MKFISLLSALLLTNFVFAQIPQNFIEPDKCGYPDTTTAEFQIAASGNWGYGFDTLLYDISQWKKSMYVIVDSIGATVQKRTIYMLTIQDPSKILVPKKRVWIHARTHPGEVQGTWVTNEMIKILLSDTPLGKKLRDSCIFNIVPMYNPDGVELGKARTNANNIDLESNWNTFPSQPEVNVLRSMFTKLMAEQYPIRIALNMHSAYECKKFFWYHDVSGTSQLYGKMQRQYIDTVRSNYPEWIMPWDSHISWVGSASRVYPESWFWYTHKEKVLALTYEDMNCATAHSFDKTANALAQGIADYLGLFGNPVSVQISDVVPNNFLLLNNYPNPFNPATTISYTLTPSPLPKGEGLWERVTLKIYDALGRKVATLVNEEQMPGSYEVQWNAKSFSSGMYFVRLESNNKTQLKKMLLLK